MKSKFVHLPYWAQSRPSRPQVSLPGNAKVASLFSASLMSYPLSTSILSLGTSTRSSQGHTTETRGWALVTSLHNKGETDYRPLEAGRGGGKTRQPRMITRHPARKFRHRSALARREKTPPGSGPERQTQTGARARSTRHSYHYRFAESYLCLKFFSCLRVPAADSESAHPPVRTLRCSQPQPMAQCIAGLADAAWAWAYEVADLLVSASVSRTKSATSMVPLHRHRITRLLFHGEGHAAAWVYGFVVLPHLCRGSTGRFPLRFPRCRVQHHDIMVAATMTAYRRAVPAGG